MPGRRGRKRRSAQVSAEVRTWQAQVEEKSRALDVLTEAADYSADALRKARSGRLLLRDKSPGHYSSPTASQ